MRSADLSRSRGLASGWLPVVLVAAGCATAPTPSDSGAAEAARAASASTTAAAAAPASSATGATAPMPAAAAPVDPALQRAFDDARAAFAAGRVDEAERAFLALAGSHPELGGAQASLGLIHRRAGRLAEAAKCFEAAVEANPSQPVFLNQLGVTYRQLGEFAKAREAYERAIAADAAYAPSVINLGILEDLYLGQPQRALPLYERYQALLPEPDPMVVKWVADLRNRKPAQVAARKEQP